MDRRKSLKALALGTLSTGVVLESCKLMDKKEEAAKTATADAAAGFSFDRNKDELAYEKTLQGKKFFSAHEMATITLLADIILPKDDASGSASDAGVPAFIDFIVQDMPSHQVPMQGGLRWLDTQSNHRFGKSFVDCDKTQQMEIVDDIAWPERKIKPGMEQGVSFFNLMRDLTLTGFYTSEIGVKDLGYQGNVPNKWNGVPAEELKRLNLAYSEWEMQNCAKYE